MTKPLRIISAQLNLTVGDLSGNLNKHLEAAGRARDELKADVIVFPELGLTGYPPEDLLLRHDFLKQTEQALQHFISTIKDIHCVISHPYATPKGLYNACSLVHNGTLLGRYSKQHLPNYGVFDENRYFIPGHSPCVVPIHGILVGLVICEDLWFPGPIQQAAALGARVILSPNASPFEVDKHAQRVAMLATRAKQNHVSIVYTNNIGGQDELVFDGGSMGVNEEGTLCQFAGFFNEALLPVDITITATQTHMDIAPISLPNKEEKIYQALVLAVRDYLHKNHFSGVYVGVSGGIDSALTLAIAVDALGKDQVKAVIMPSRYTSDISLQEAAEIVQTLGVQSNTLSIEPAYKAMLESLAPIHKAPQVGITEQNIQARCRAMILMALSNKDGSLVLTTGNRSEIAVGYCTLYGDMAGGFAVLKDIPKTLVYTLAHYRNTLGQVIPPRTIDRPPTAELAPDQKDEDSLPPYPILDRILDAYLNQGQSAEAISAQGFDQAVVAKIIMLVQRSEYKRRQSAIGPHINHQSFGKDWRYPITNGFNRKVGCEKN